MGATSGGIRMNRLACTVLSLLAVALVLGVGTASAQDYVYDVGYYANANATGSPSAHLRLTNDGADDGYNLCANIYVFDNTEEMKECCSCQITANGYLDLSVPGNLLSNILDHGTKPTRGIIKEVSSYVPSSGYCNPTYYTPYEGIKGWLTHVQKGATAGTFSLTETTLTDSYLNSEELDFNLEETCSFVLSLGTGTGACSCTDFGD
jgi:hypothetical protein